MATDTQLVQHLNAVLRCKLTGINQYFLHARMLKHQGNVRLADYEYKASIDAMKHADMLVELVLGLGGLPDLQELGKLLIGAHVGEMLRNDLTLAETALSQIESAIAFCEKKQDKATSGLLGKIIDSQREHIDFLRAQISSQPIKDCA